MTFSPLETLLIAAGMSLVVGIASRLIGDKKYVSHAQCRERRDGVCEDVMTLKEAQDKANRDNGRKTDILFRMVRALVIHAKDVPDGVKTKILNETPGD